MEVPVPEDPEDLPDTPVGRTFKAVARQMLTPPAVRFLHGEAIEKIMAEFAKTLVNKRPFDAG